MPEGFVHVYDLPTKFNTDLVSLPTIWHPEQYEIDQVGPATALYLWCSPSCIACLELG